MTSERLFRRHRGLVLAAAVVAPAGLCGLLSLAPGLIENTSAALLLVLVVVGAASTGLRGAGLLAAASAAVSFDFFLTAPYLTLQIVDRTDIETAVGLLLVGIAVTELALWGRRQQARASQQSGYLDGLLAATEIAAASSDHDAAIEYVERRLVTILDLDVARFHYDVHGGLPCIAPDGRVLADGHPLEVDRAGLPTDTELSLPIRVDGRTRGEFRLTAATHVARPTREQRRVAALLADQAVLALGSSELGSSELGPSELGPSELGPSDGDQPGVAARPAFSASQP